MAAGAGTAWIAVKPKPVGFDNTLGSRIKSGLKRGVVAAGVAAGATLGAALYKGFGRLQAIEDARAKLEGLGHSAKAVDGIMKDALASVKGTAFGLDEAATVAAGAVAAGIKPGRDLERTLKLVADAATIGGTSMGEMGQIFNKVATSNKVQGDVINQLSDRGIPIVKLLGKEMGLTGEQVLEASRKGKIGFDDFRAAMEAGMGGAALKSGETLRGSFKNTLAAIGRVGANLLSGVYPLFRKFFTGLIDFLGPLEEKAASAGEVLGRVLESVVGWLIRATRFVKENSTAFKVALVVLGSLTAAIIVYRTTVTVVTAVTKAWAWAQALLNKKLALNPIGLVVVALVALGAGLVLAYKKSETFRAIVDKAWAVIKQSVKAAWNGVIKPALSAFSGFVTNTLGPAVRWLWQKVVKPYFEAVGAYVKFVWQKLVKPYLSLWWDFISNVLGPGIKWLWNKVVSPIFSSIGGHIKTVWRDIVKPVLKAFGDFISDTVAPAFRKGVGVIGDVWDGIKEMARKPVNFVIDTVYNNGIRKAFNGVASFLGMKSRLPHMATIGGDSGGGSKAKPHGSAPGGHVAGGGGGRPGTGKHAHPADAMGGPFDFVKNIAGKGGKWLTGKMMAAVSGLAGKLGDHPFAQMLGATAKKMALGAVDFVKGKLGAKKKADKLAKGAPGKAGRVLPAGSYSIGVPYLGYPGHYGADYPAASGTPVYSLRSGVVTRAMSLTGSYGKHVYVDAPGGFQNRYAHLSAIGVRPGQRVNAGAFLGRVGSTGNSSGNHLHFEDRLNNVARNPASLGVFDRGGKLPTGLSAVFNGTGRTEAVLTDHQWRDMHTIAKSAAQNTKAGVNVTQNVTTTDPLAASGHMADRLVRALGG